jgi:hypothetical protein
MQIPNDRVVRSQEKLRHGGSTGEFERYFYNEITSAMVMAVVTMACSWYGHSSTPGTTIYLKEI